MVQRVNVWNDYISSKAIDCFKKCVNDVNMKLILMKSSAEYIEMTRYTLLQLLNLVGFLQTHILFRKKNYFIYCFNDFLSSLTRLELLGRPFFGPRASCLTASLCHSVILFRYVHVIMSPPAARYWIILLYDICKIYRRGAWAYL